ncbi:hypothetical protein ONS95_012690 [Cadophora gregata]|uniref:uncharacterized protein n=1 Tax=Cadophora gregata TaxID=51156 RepID=UPI0026DB67D4|nr:uncharacterized protein ONS95_012690 [Cadophora gregata]KAK0118401.1 hypothetical protein ONS95_012690 [Cadophora gregata]KAK0123471.1 hypothetical protein ONS96_010454 [Cadophora gregata f. sp. sojae]
MEDSRPDAAAGSGGHGTLEILGVIDLFKDNGIDCCVVGTSALKYFGAWRIRHDWELCVPTELLEKASSLLRSAPHDKIFEPAKHERPQIQSLIHTFPRFKFKGVRLFFDLVSAHDAHIICHPSNFEWSLMGLPYPRLELYAQSLLDTLSWANISDLIDAMDLTEEWGASHMELDKSNDVAWALNKNEKIRASVPLTLGSCFLEVDEGPMNLKEVWNNEVRTKGKRLGEETLKEVYLTRFRPKGSGDPRLVKNTYC